MGVPRVFMGRGVSRGPRVVLYKRLEGGCGAPTRVYGAGGSTVGPIGSHVGVPGGGDVGPTRVYGAGGVIRGSHRVPCSGIGGEFGVPRVFMGRGSSVVPIESHVGVPGGGRCGSHACLWGGGVLRGSHRVPYSGLGVPREFWGCRDPPLCSHGVPYWGSWGSHACLWGGGVLRGSHRVP